MPQSRKRQRPGKRASAESLRRIIPGHFTYHHCRESPAAVASSSRVKERWSSMPWVRKPWVASTRVDASVIKQPVRHFGLESLTEALTRITWWQFALVCAVGRSHAGARHARVALHAGGGVASLLSFDYVSCFFLAELALSSQLQGVFSVRVITPKRGAEARAKHALARPKYDSYFNILYDHKSG